LLSESGDFVIIVIIIKFYFLGWNYINNYINIKSKLYIRLKILNLIKNCILLEYFVCIC
jgi:hypothetical protein